jgi:hypothetical protein
MREIAMSKSWAAFQIKDSHATWQALHLSQKTRSFPAEFGLAERDQISYFL